jgi:DNA-binding response OmpR family regulator
MEQNILVVEDEEAMRMVLSDRLRRKGYAVDCAADGETGFQKATSLPFDLMIFDIMLPGRSGLDLCRDVRGAGLGAPILLLSAYQQVKTAGFDAGADDYMTKPFDMLELNARVEALLRRAPAGRFPPQSTDSPQQMLTEESEGLPAKATVERLISPANSLPASTLREEFERRIDAQKDSLGLSEVILRLRKTLDEERQIQQTLPNAPWLGVAEGVIKFLEEILQGRAPRRRH